MQIWVDADACPVVIKDILCRAANRTQILTTFVANQHINIPPSRYIQTIRVARGFDVADHQIISQLQPHDLVITSDIPLAADAIEKGAVVLSHRGQRYTPENIREILNMRDFMESLRDNGLATGGPAALSQQDRQVFATELNKILTPLT